MKSFLIRHKVAALGLAVIALACVAVTLTGWYPSVDRMVALGSLLALGSVAAVGLNITDDAIAYLIKQGLLDAAGGWKFPEVKAKTADYTIVTGTDPSGTLFTNRGAAGTVIFTLPAPSAAIKGVFYSFAAVVAAQTVTVKTATVDTLITFNDLTADSVSLQTSGEIIGGMLRAICDGTSWIVFGDSGAAHTYTVAT